MQKIVIVISKFLKLYSKAKCTSAPAYSRALRRIKGVFPKGVTRVKRSSGPISRIPGGDRVAVKGGVAQVEKVNDQMGQGRSRVGVLEKMMFEEMMSREKHQTRAWVSGVWRLLRAI